MTVVNYGLQVWGEAALNPNVTITTGVNDRLTFKVDGVDCNIVLDAGSYITNRDAFSSTLIPQINAQLTLASIAVTARLGGINADTHTDVLIFEHNMTDAGHTIDAFAGNGNDTLFRNIYRIREPISY
jgi:flagellin